MTASEHRRRRRLPVAAAALTAGVLLLPVPAAAQAEPVATGPSAEAWYRPVLLEVPPELDPCTLPVGCLPDLPVAPPSQYAPGTLHVGVSAGREESRTYLALDLSTVPFGAAVTGGTLTLPVATDPQAGTVSPETASLRACVVTGAVQDGVEGAVTAPPAIDCATSSPTVFVPATGEAPPSFTVDVAPFAATWSAGLALLAIVPAEALEPTATWHVAFSRRDRQAEGAVPISAALQVAEAPAADEAATPPSVTVAVGTPSFAGGSTEVPSFDSGASFAAPPLSAGTQPLTAPVTPAVAASQVQVPVAAVLAGPFAYPAVFLLPLLVAGAVGWAGRAFTRELVPVRA